MSGLPRDFGQDLAVTCPRPDCARPPGRMCGYVIAPPGCGHELGEDMKVPHSERRKLGRLVRERERVLAAEEEAVWRILADRELDLAHLRARVTNQLSVPVSRLRESVLADDLRSGGALRSWLAEHGRILWDRPAGDDGQFLAPDEDPDVALAVIEGRARGSKTYAAVCLATAIRHGRYPAGWFPV